MRVKKRGTKKTRKIETGRGETGDPGTQTDIKGLCYDLTFQNPGR